MSSVQVDPPLPVGPTDGFVQSIRLIDNAQTIAHCRWHVAGDGSGGVVQLLEFTTTRPRQGHGKQLLNALLAQIRGYFKQHRIKPRRVWMNVEQKKQVIGRAFLTEHGFHHVATIPMLLKDQDALIYVLSLD